MNFIFVLIILILVVSIVLTINVWKKSKRSINRKVMMTIIYWILILIIELVLINIYFSIGLKL